MAGSFEYRKRIGDNLRKIRLEKGLMQVDVAVATDLDRSYISKIEAGKARITTSLLWQLVNGLEITSADLVDGKNQSDSSYANKSMEIMARKYLKWVDAPIWVKIGRNIRDCRKWKGFTPEQVASSANIDLKRYKRMERAIVRDITFDEVFRIIKVLKISDDCIIHY